MGGEGAFDGGSCRRRQRAIPPEERRKHQTEDEVGPKGYEGEESSQ